MVRKVVAGAEKLLLLKESCSWYETVVADKGQSSMIKKSRSWCREFVDGEGKL